MLTCLADVIEFRLINFNDFLSGYDINYYFLGRMNIVKYVKNDFLQKLGTLTLIVVHKTEIVFMLKGTPFRQLN